MSQRATQIYLSPEQHAALRKEAARSGRSMTAVVRELIDTHILAEGPPPTDFGVLVGSVRFGRPTDIAANKDQMISDAIADHLRRR